METTKISVHPKNDKKLDSRQSKSKVSSATQVVKTTTNSNSFDALGSMGGLKEASNVGHFSSISEKELNNLNKHGPKPNCVEVVNKDKRVFSIWKAFGGNTRDLGSFGEETDKTTDLHQHLSRISTQKLETASQITRDAVITHLKTASQDLKTASECTTQPII
ncbi:hypothetical protein Tco_0503339 [Tanacetum coccineum]